MNAKVIGAFIAGFATGAGAAYAYCRRKIDDIIEEDRENTRSLYRKRYSKAVDTDEEWVTPEKAFKEVSKDSTKKVKGQKTDYTKFAKKGNEEEPKKKKVAKPVKNVEEKGEIPGEIPEGIKRITEQDYIANIEGDREFHVELLEFDVANSILTDGYGNVVDYIEATDLIGAEIYEALQDFDEAVIYVRNYNYYIDYKIIRSSASEENA